MIHLVDGRTDEIVATIPENLVEDNLHRKSKKDFSETFSFRAHLEDYFGEYVGERNRIVIPVEDGKFQEFIIQAVTKVHDGEGTYVDVDALASYQSLVRAKVIYPQFLAGQTARTVAQFAVNATEFELGVIPSSASKDVTIESHTEPFSFLKRMAAKFDFDIDFRIEHDGNKVTKRFVDFLSKDKEFSGRELVVGKDITSIERKEDTTDVITALVGLGPTDSEGARITVVATDEDALLRWGRGGRHLYDVYEVENVEEGATEAELLEKTQAKLSERIDSVVEYKANVVDFEKLLGMDHKKLRFGDKVRVKDLNFKPALYLEAEVHTQDRDIYDRETKVVELGNFEELSEEEVLSIWHYIRQEIQERVTTSQLLDITYDKVEIDTKDGSVLTDSKLYAESEASSAESSAKGYTDTSLVDPVNRISTAEDNIGTLDTNLNSAQEIIDSVTGEKDGVTVLEGTLITNNIIAENAIFTGNIEAGDLVVNHGTFNDITVTGTIVSAEINSANIDIDEDIRMGRFLRIGQTFQDNDEKGILMKDSIAITNPANSDSLYVSVLSEIELEAFGSLNITSPIAKVNGSDILTDGDRYGDGQLLTNPFSQNLEFYQDNNTERIVVRRDGVVIGSLAWNS